MESWRRELGRLAFRHYGVSKLDGAKVGSGRYPLGSGKNPRAVVDFIKQKKAEGKNAWDMARDYFKSDMSKEFLDRPGVKKAYENRNRRLSGGELTPEEEKLANDPDSPFSEDDWRVYNNIFDKEIKKEIKDYLGEYLKVPVDEFLVPDSWKKAPDHGKKRIITAGKKFLDMLNASDVDEEIGNKYYNDKAWLYNH